MRSRISGARGTRSRKTRSCAFSGRSLSWSLLSAPSLVRTSITRALMSFSFSARATETRWWPSRTKWRSPMRKTSIGGIASPRLRASAMRSQRPRVPGEGRKSRSTSPRRRSTVPTIESSGMTCSPRSTREVAPSAATTSSKGSMCETSSGSKRSREASRESTRRRRSRSKAIFASSRGRPVLTSHRDPRLERGDALAVGFQQIVHQSLNLVHRQLGPSMGVEHGRLVDRVAPSGERRLHGQTLDVDVGLNQRRELARERAHRLRLDPGRGRQARHLHAAVGGQVVDQQALAGAVRDVAVEAEGRAALAGGDDVGAVLMAALDADRAAALELGAQALPGRDLPLAAARVLVERDVERLDQVLAPVLDEPW